MKKEKPKMSAGEWFGIVLFVVLVVYGVFAVLALPTCIIYWWIGMSGTAALAIDIAVTALIVAGIVTAAYYAD